MRLAAAAILAAAVAADPTRAAARAFDVAPPPAWAEPLAWDRTRAAPADAADGLDYALVEDQVRLSPAGEVERFRHRAWRIVSTTGVENGSEVEVSFDPAYERLTFHSVVIHRGARRIDAFDAKAVKVIQQEEELDRRLYDGRLTAVLFLRGVRAGDAVEVAYTLRGANPVFGGRYADALALGWDVPVALRAVRLLVPDGRTVAARAHGAALEPVTSRRPGFTEYRWERAPAPGAVHEDRVPFGVDEDPWLQLSEWRDWGEVSTWAAALHATPSPTREMEAELARWRPLPEEERVLAAVRFVQDEIRYLGIELGPSSHRPHAPAEVLERRFGDCKDKSLLLVTLLRALGVEAETALVATEDREALDARLPSPLAFDHVVVRARVGGTWRWIDPTVTLERGPLASRDLLPYRRALPVRDGAAPVAIDDPAPRPVVVGATLTVPRFGAPATLEVRTRRGGDDATALRRRLASDPLPKLARGWLDFYARLYPGVRAQGAPEVRDDPATGAIEVVERYELPAVREGDELPVRAAEIADELEEPEVVLRKQPLAISHPVDIRETIRVVLPGPPDLEDDDATVDTPATRFRRRIHVEGRAIVTELSYRTVADRVAADRAAAFADSVRKMRRAAGVALPLGLARARAVARSDAPPGGSVALTLGGLAVFAALLLGIWWLANGGASALALASRRRAFARKFRHATGDSPQTALAVAAPGDVERAVERTRCACGGRLAPAGPRDAVRFGGRELAVVPLACERCGAARPLYAAWPE